MKKVNCNIIKDLLPNYIDKLTSKETNELIENHLKECEECKETYNKMNNDIDIHWDMNYEEATYMKKIHKKFIIMSICIVILIAIICTIIFGMKFITSHTFLNGKVYRGEYIVSNNTHLFVEYQETEHQKVKLILTIDENGICQSTRKIKEAKTEKGLKQITEEYNLIDANKDQDTMHTNCKIEGKIISYNYNVWNGEQKEEIIKKLKQDNINISIVEY